MEVNDRVILTCSALSVPPANFTWRFNGSVTKVTTATFLIEQAVYKDTGTYTCEAYNAVTGRTGQATHFLTVKGEPPPGVAPARRRPPLACLTALWLQRRARWRRACQTEPSPGSSLPSWSPSAPPSASSCTADRKSRE